MSYKIKAFIDIGTNKKINVDVRIISASSYNLEKSVEEGKLREDLFYRLSVVPISIPPLNQRSDDILYSSIIS